MPLEEDQKAWLQTSLKGKGFLASKEINKQFKNYTRRRAKVAEVVDPLPRSHSNYLHMQSALTSADKDAKEGRFKEAYKSLSTAKALAKATDAGTSGKILENEIAQSVKLLTNTVGSHILDVDGVFGKIDAALTGFTTLQPCSGAGSIENGVAQMKIIVGLEPNLRGTLTALKGDCNALEKRFGPRGIPKQVTALREELERLAGGGYATIADKYRGQVDTAENRYQGGNEKYNRSNSATKHLEAVTLESEKILLDRKNLESFMQQPRQPDTRTDNVRSMLNPLDPLDELMNLIRESDRMEEVRQQFLAEKAKDGIALAKVGTVDLELTPEPPQFQAADVLGDIDVDGSLQAVDVSRHATQVGNNLKNLLKDKGTPQSVLLDLMSKSAETLSGELFEELFAGKERSELSPEQEELLSTLATTMFNAINAEAPNKVSADADSVSVGGQTFNKVKILKAGGLGTATLFEDPVSGKKMVMKTPNIGDKNAYNDLLKEMKTMNRAQEGAVDSPNASAIPEFFGAARGEDGSMHMLMEFIDGGDMSEVSATMNAIGNSGLMPKAALKAMQGDLIGKAAEALGELQRQGLMHHDIKGLNIMMTKGGEVKIIDYGESTFVGEDGTAKRKDMGNATPGYSGKDAFQDGATVTVDNFALGSMLMSMVEQRQVDKWNRNESDTGALGRLIQALHKSPDQRVSLEGLAQSTFMSAGSTEYGEEAMSELRQAATDFTQATKSLKSDKSYDELRDNLSSIKFDDGTELFSGLYKPDKTFGLDDAQDLIGRFDEKIEAIMRDLQSSPKKTNDEREKTWLLTNRQKLEDLTKAKAYVQSQVIDDLLDKAIKTSDDAYQRALDDPTKKIEIIVSKKKTEITIKDAVAKYEDFKKLLQLRRNETITWLENATGEVDEIQDELYSRNQELVTIDTIAKHLRQEIQRAAGPEAGLHFSKENLDAATVPFGPSEGRRQQSEIAADSFQEVMGQLQNLNVAVELEGLAT